MMKLKGMYAAALLLALTSCAGEKTYKNAGLDPQERAELLVKELTLDEKVSLMMDGSKPVERLGIKTYNWWNEALHGVARAGVATVFPQPIGLAATWSPDDIYKMYTAVSDEARAKYVYYASQDSRKRYQGLTFWTPTVNIYRDPRWGRGIETYGEDPYLTGRMGVQVVKGLQGGNDGKYDKLHACAKHFAVHSGPEWNRHEFNAENIKPRDLWETYLPPFEALVKEGDVKEVMCAYNRFEGDPCCGSDRLLMQILRDEWQYEGIVLSDCSAINDFFNDKGHHTHADAASASAAAVLSGTDLECGGVYANLTKAVAEGKIDTAAIDRAVIRLMKARFELGEMDPLESVSWNSIPYSVVGSDEHRAIALEMARKSMTLLTNNNHALPLNAEGLKVAVMGPNANDSTMQWGNYNGTPKQTITILEGIRNLVGDKGTVIYEPGCGRVERTLTESVFAQCRSAEGAGFHATYWNNKKREGEPVAEMQMTSPFQLCTSGATVFAPGVNLTDFAATYTTLYTPLQSGEVELMLFVNGEGRLYIDGEEKKSFRQNHGARNWNYAMQVEAGRKYDIRIEFEYRNDDAQFNLDMGVKRDVNIARSVAAVKDADVVVFVGGISPRLEGEEMSVNYEGFKRGDRTDIELPKVQRELLAALKAAGKKVILVNCSGSPIALEPETKTCDAILQAWYPGQEGGTAVAEVLFGAYNPSGKLPVTFYRNLGQLPDFESYDMAGRTYRYMTEEPLFVFGHGLSYTTFGYGAPTLAKEKIAAGETLKLSVPVTNSGKRDGEEVVQVYLKKQGDVEGPVKALRAFKRVSIPAGETVNVAFELGGKELEWWDEQTNTMHVTAGVYDYMVGGDSKAQKQGEFVIE